MWFIRSLIFLVFVIAFLWVGMQNTGEKVTFKLFNKEFVDLWLNLLLLIVFLVGMVFSFIIAVIMELQLRTQIGRQRRQIARLKEELAALRSLPLDDAEPVSSENEVVIP